MIVERKRGLSPFTQRIRSATKGNVVLGSKRFEEQIAQMLRRRVTRGQAGRPKRSGEHPKQQFQS